MKFSSADFASSAASSTVKQRRRKVTRLRQGHLLLPVVPPSPLFEGINQNDINSEAFPDIVDLKDPGPVDATLEHCVIHCVHAVCIQMVEATHRERYPLFSCNCVNMVEPRAELTNLHRPINTMNDDTIRDIMEVTKGTKCDVKIVLRDEPCHEILGALQSYFATSSSHIKTLVLNLSKEIPVHKATAAAHKAQTLLFDNLTTYFDRTFALYDCASSVGTKHREVTAKFFVFELENYILTVLTDFMEIYCGSLLSSGAQYPPTVRLYIKNGGIPKIVWDSWNEIIAHLMRMLQWSNIESKKQK